jgi:hypothetical protein
MRRHLVVPSGITLGRRHDVLQAAFGWDDDHLHCFDVRGVRYERVRPDAWGPVFGDPPRDEDRTPLHRVAARPGDVIEYTYDFGDDWRHRIEVERVGPAVPGQQYPACTDGAGLPPEEDLGTPRKGRFDDRSRTRLNQRLRREGAVDGRDLRPAYASPDPAFAGLFPDLVDDSGDCPCGCGETLDADPPPLPMTRPVDVRDLARLAAGSLLVHRAVTLTRWLGDGRAVTPSRLPRPADAVRAVAELGLVGQSSEPQRRAVPATEPQLDDAPEPAQAALFGTPAPETRTGPAVDPDGRRIRSAKDLPHLHELWSACVVAGLIEIRGSHARPGAGLAIWTGPSSADDPERVARQQVESWCQLVAGALRARDDVVAGRRDQASSVRRQVLHLSLPLLYTTAHAPFPAGALTLTLAAIDQDDDLLTGPMLHLLPLVAVEVRRTLDFWLAAGALEPVALDPEQAARHEEALTEDLVGLVRDHHRRYGGGQADAERSVTDLVDTLSGGTVVRLTPLGRSALARILTAHGWPVPASGDRRDDAPEDLLDRLAGYLAQDAAEELADWVCAHGAAPLLRVIRSAGQPGGAGPARRETLGMVLPAAGPRIPGLDAALDAVSGDRWLDATVASVRHDLGTGPEPTTGQLLWLVVDTLSTLLDDPDDFAADVSASPLPRLLSRPGAMAAALALDHPAAPEVLHAAAPHLGDAELTRALRKAFNGRNGNPALRPSSSPAADRGVRPGGRRGRW